MERKDAIRGAYRLTGGNNFYDGMITCSALSGKAVCRLVWAMNKAENDAYLEKDVYKRQDDVRKLHRGDDADARGGALAVQQGERDGGAVVGQRERVDQILEKRHFGKDVYKRQVQGLDFDDLGDAPADDAE